jgi:hypothetical protein
MLPLLIRLILFAALVYSLYRLVVLLFPRRPEFKCATCRHCGHMDNDGVICRYLNRETFKTPVHIQNCMDYEDDPRIPGPR